MIIKVKVHPGSKQEKLVKKEDMYEAWIHAKAVDGKANIALIDLLSEEFDIPKSSVNIIDLKGKIKRIELL